MIRKLLFVSLLGSAFLTACDTKEKAELQVKVDSLQDVLVKKEAMENTLQQVGALMDSIDAGRQLLKVNMVEGTSYNDYAARMADINKYVKETQAKIDDLENSLSTSANKSKSLSKIVSDLKKQLTERANEIETLKAQAERSKNERDSLVLTVGLRDSLLHDKDLEIEAKQQELALIEARIQELMIQSKMSEGDAYYARAVAVEEVANRTKFAPRKKKEALREALELYKKSLSFGKEEAQAKIDELEKEI